MNRRAYAFLSIAAALWLLTAGVAWLSRQFVHGQGYASRPIVAVLTLLGLAFVLHLVGLKVAFGCRPTRRLTAAIFSVAVLLRLTLLPSSLIQEVDIYRYLWDGLAANQGVSPFAYSPQQVIEATAGTAHDESLRRLVAAGQASPDRTAILHRVHYGHLPTIYPPVSQAVFAVAIWLTPNDATLALHLLVMKACLMVFDLGTLGLILALLQTLGRHPAWSIVYAWCPLVVKEFANSGHLDAVAVFWTTLACYLLVRMLVAHSPLAWQWQGALGAVVALALAVGAKLYAVVLAPLFLSACWRRLGWRATIALAALWAILTLGLVWPLLPGGQSKAPEHTARLAEKTVDAPAVPGETTTSAAGDGSRGLTTFLTRWEMNDLVFLTLVENFRLQATRPAHEQAWFVVLPERLRRWVIRPVARWGNVSEHVAAFFVARGLTGLAFILVAGWLVLRKPTRASVEGWLEAAFLTLAWFWLLAPTQNPWYWIWAMPLLPFAKARAWLAVSGLTLVYYLRFWLIYQWPNSPVLGAGYHGTEFFDFVVVWLEFGPWFLWLSWEFWGRVRRARPFIDAGQLKPG